MMNKMITSVTPPPTDLPESSILALKLVMERLHSGAVMAFATETVWGLGVLPTFANRLSHRKGRDTHKAYQLSCSSATIALCMARPDARLNVLHSLWPGALTAIARPSATCPIAAQTDGWVGLRVPDAPLLRLVLQHTPLLTTSLNPAHKPPAISDKEARAYALADFLLEDMLPTQTIKNFTSGAASTVIRLEDNGDVCILREGILSQSGALTQYFPNLIYHSQEQTP